MRRKSKSHPDIHNPENSLSQNSQFHISEIHYLRSHFVNIIILTIY